MELLLMLLCLFLLYKDIGGSSRGRVFTNPDPDEEDDSLIDD